MIEGTSLLVFDELDLIVWTLIGDVTEEFDSLVFDELDTIIRTLLEDITDKFDRDDAGGSPCRLLICLVK
jgi:hypothetical protein